MALFRRIIAALIRLEEYEILEVERLIADIRHRRYRCAPVIGHFAHFTDSNGDIAMSFKINTAYKAPLLFVDATGSPVAGPTGTVTATDSEGAVVAAANVSLSDDGQTVNMTFSDHVTGDVLLTWHDPAGAVPDFNALVDTDNGSTASTAVSGSFGAFSEVAPPLPAS